MSLLGFYSKKEVNQIKLKSYENGYKAGVETSSLINKELSNRIKILEEDNKICEAKLKELRLKNR